MHSSAHHRHGETPTAAGVTKGLILDGGWRYDLREWFHDIVSFRGRVRQLRRRVADLARIRPGERALDVGCGTGTLAIDVARRVGPAGRAVGIDPAAQQIARARAKSARRKVPVEFEIGAIERLPFPDRTFDVVLSSLMMHHLPPPLKRQGLAEIARVLKPGGRLVIADFTPRRGRTGRAARFHAGGSDMEGLAALVRDAGFEALETEEMRPPRFSAFPGAGIVRARKSPNACAASDAEDR